MSNKTNFWVLVIFTILNLFFAITGSGLFIIVNLAVAGYCGYSAYQIYKRM